MKEFTTTGICSPEKHYMVDISERLIAIKRMVDAGKYFCMNPGHTKQGGSLLPVV